MSSASRTRAPVPDAGFGRSWTANASKSPSAPRLRRDGCHFMMLYQLGDALLRNSTRIPLGREPVPLLQTRWTHASRNTESLIKLARPYRDFDRAVPSALY